MGTEAQKTEKSTTVRIYENTKGRLQKVVRRRSDLEERDVTEVELADQALSKFLENEERRLGMPPSH